MYGAPLPGTKKKNAGNQSKKGAGGTSSAWERVELLKRKQNQDLLAMLEEEQEKENQREEMKSRVSDPAELERLEKIFGLERAKANEQIMRVVEFSEKSVLFLFLSMKFSSSMFVGNMSMK